MKSETAALLDNLAEKFHIIRIASLINTGDNDFVAQIADEGVMIIDQFKKLNPPSVLRGDDLRSN